MYASDIVLLAQDQILRLKIFADFTVYIETEQNNFILQCFYIYD